MFAFLKNIGPTEILVVLAILLLLFGSRVVKMLARSGGESLREIKKIKKNFTEHIGEIKDETDRIKGGV